MQTVFKIDLLKDGAQLGERPFIPRRVHKKSRGGCSACKKRRIKCDEGKPRCGKCTKTNTDCVYASSPDTSPKTLFIDERSPSSLTSDMHTMCVVSSETELGGLLSVTLSSSSSPSDLDSFIFSNDSPPPLGRIQILQHFQNFTSLTLGGDSCRGIFHSVVARKAWDIKNPYLMHMVLAVSSAHLKRLYYSAADSGMSLEQMKLYQQYSIAEAAHWQAGLQLYQKLLSRRCSRSGVNDTDEDSDTTTPPPLPDFDATLATTFLTIIFTFALDDSIPIDAYTTQDEDKFHHAINPLAASGGFRALHDVFGDYMFESSWKPVLMGSDDDKGTYSREGQGIKGLPAALVDLCGLQKDSNAENNEYYHIVCLLTPLLRLDNDLNNFTKLIAFCGRTWPYFRPLVLRRDPRGLLLLSYWFAVLGQLDQWWLKQRAKTECLAIVNFLAQLEDAEIDALLPFPASFGQAELSYLWDKSPRIGKEVVGDSAAIFERYFQKAVTTHKARS